MNRSAPISPEVSVLIPSYNHERYIGKTIDSVLSQEQCDFELLVVDDCSTDESRKIIEKAASNDPRVRVKFHERNMGIASTLTELMDSAEGRFIVFLSSDDMLLPGGLSRMTNTIAADPTIDILIFDGDCIDDAGQSLGYSFWELHARPPDEEKDIFDALLRSNFILSAMIKLKTVREKQLHPLTELEYLNDWVFWLDAALSCKFKVIHEKLYAYRIHGGNTSFKDRWLEDSANALTMMLGRYSGIMDKKQIAMVEYFRGLSLIKIQNYHEGRRALFRSLTNDPISQRGRNALLVLLLSFTHTEGEIAINALGRLKFQKVAKLDMFRIRQYYRRDTGKRD